MVVCDEKLRAIKLNSTRVDGEAQKKRRKRGKKMSTMG